MFWELRDIGDLKHVSSYSTKIISDAERLRDRKSQHISTKCHHLWLLHLSPTFSAFSSTGWSTYLLPSEAVMTWSLLSSLSSMISTYIQEHSSGPRLRHRTLSVLVWLNGTHWQRLRLILQIIWWRDEDIDSIVFNELYLLNVKEWLTLDSPPMANA